MKHKKILTTIATILLLLMMFTVTVTANPGNVAGAIQGTWNSARDQIQTVVNTVVFPALALILSVLFFVKLGSAYFDYKKTGHFEITAPAILFAGIIIVLTAPLYIWTIIG